jgi:hypothetical protein
MIRFGKSGAPDLFQPVIPDMSQIQCMRASPGQFEQPYGPMGRRLCSRFPCCAMGCDRYRRKTALSSGINAVRFLSLGV